LGLVTLVSGGVDSILMSLLAREEGIDLFPLFVDYGQLCVDREWKACSALHKKYRLPKPRRMNLSGFGGLIESGLTTKRLRINEDAFLPGRNSLFLLVGASYACQVHADAVAIGILTEEHHLFPDQTSAFVRSCEETFEIALGKKVALLTPLIKFSKADVLQLAKKKNISGTYSCHAGGPKPCGKCVSCVEVLKAQAEKE